MTPGNQGGFYRLTEDVDIVSPYPGGYAVNNFQTGEWLEYTINVTQPGAYRLEALASSPMTGSRWHMEIDGVNVTGPVTVPTTASWATFQWTGVGGVSLAAGSHVLRFYSEAQYFNLDALRTILLDTTPPSVSVTAPLAGQNVAGSITVSASASDNVGVVGVQLKLDGANLGAEFTSPPYSLSWNTTGAANGSHALTAVARDAAGNSTVSAPVTVTVSNNPAPVISSVSASGVSASGATIAWTTDLSADTQVEYGPTSSYGSSTTLNTSLVTSHSQALSGLTAGTLYHYRVKSRDAAGNLATSGDFTFTIVAGVDPALLSYLKMDEGSGTTAADASGNGNAGSLMNGAGWTAGHSGQAVALDGVNAYVRIPHAAALDAYPLSVAVWFKTSTTTGWRSLVNKYVGGSMNGYQVFLYNGSLCAWYFKNGSNYVYDGSGCTLPTPGYNDGQWHQAVFVVDAAGGRLYVDGRRRGAGPGRERRARPPPPRRSNWVTIRAGPRRPRTCRGRSTSSRSTTGP